MTNASLWIIRLALTVQFLGVLAVPGIIADAGLGEASGRAHRARDRNHIRRTLMDRHDHFLCESCGSTDVSGTKLSKLDRLLRKVAGRKRFTCGSCGWTGLRNWSHTPAALDTRRPRASRSRLRASRAASAKALAMRIDRAPQLDSINQ